MKRMTYVALALALVACKKETAQAPPAAPPAGAPTGTQAHQALTPAAAAAVPANPAALLTEARVKGYLIYMREMTAISSQAMGMAVGAFARAKGNEKELGRQLASDERAKKIAEAHNAALTKSGLTQADVSALSPILAPHFAKRMVASAAAEALAKAKAAGKANMLEQVYSKQVADGEAVRAEFEKKYGKAALALADKYEKEFLEAQQNMLRSALGGAPQPRK